MRGGICTVQQALTPEATNMVKQAVGLARRRGHAQVTPLHVASAMLATPAGLLRKACLQCHSHPLQCKALELCFNVALNRLPASSPSPLLAPHYPNPTFSNALVAAFKRAQAHQRRGSVENQQQPILALKIELEQLIISILDDPSVSRVMREAGFSSPMVKTRVEQAVSLEVNSNNTNNNNQSSNNKDITSHVLASKPLGHVSYNNGNNGKPLFEDVNNVLSAMLNKRRNTVIVGECLATAENVARGVMETFERSSGNNNSNSNYYYNNKYLQFINLPLFSLRNMSKEEAEHKLAELRCVVAKSYVGRGVVLYLGDLTWVSEFWSSSQQRRMGTGGGYSAMEQVIMEIKRLVVSGDTRVWLMGISTLQAYTKCKAGLPSLESLWELHPLTIPLGLGTTLSLSLKFESNNNNNNVEGDVMSNNNSTSTTKASKDIIIEDTDHHHCSCDVVADHNMHNSNSSTFSSLPSWLQKYRDENKRNTTTTSLTHHQEYCLTVGDLCKKWNSFCTQKNPHFADKSLNFSSLSNSTPFSSNHFNHALKESSSSPPPPPKEYQFWVLENTTGQDHGYESSVKMFVPESDNDNDDDEAVKPELLSNPNSSPNSASSSEVILDNEDDESLQTFKALNAENLRILCDEMERNAPGQKDIVPEIATAVLQCRSGMSQRKSNVLKREENSWLLFLGPDSKAKEKIARTLAKLIFGSQRNSFVSIGLSSFSSSKADSSDECSKKKKRAREDYTDRSYFQRLAEAMNENPRRVFFMEDVEEADKSSLEGIERAIETGAIELPCGETVPLKDSIVILSCESFAASGSRASSPKRSSSTSMITTKDKDHHHQVSLDLNIALVHDHRDHGARNDLDNEDSDSDSIPVGILESVDRKFIFNVNHE